MVSQSPTPKTFVGDPLQVARRERRYNQHSRNERLPHAGAAQSLSGAIGTRQSIRVTIDNKLFILIINASEFGHAIIME